MADGGGSTDSDTDSSEESLLDRYSSHLAWAAGLFLLLMIPGAAMDGDGVLGALRGLLAATILFAGALVCLPPTRRRLVAKTDVSFGRWAIAGIAIMALFLAVGIAPASDTPAVEEPGPETATPTETGTSTDAESTSATTTTPGGQTGDAPGDSTETPTRTADPPAATQTSTPTAGGGSGDTTSSTTGQSTWTVTVVRIVDGDTIEVRFEDGHTEDVRLLGVDTPEVHVENDPSEFEGIPDTDEGHEWLRDWGHRASEYARAELSGETVQIETDSQADRRGSYGRLLVYLSDDDGEFNQRLLRQGYARMYDSSFSKRTTYLELESDAQENDIGVWGFDGDGSGTSDGTATPTETPVPDGGTEHDQLVVAEIHEDAAGDDHDNLNDEYIVFENTGESALDMSGWTVSDEADHTYTVPQGFTLDPGAQVTLYTGSGENSESELYWGSERAVWNNNGDTIYVHNNDGSLVLERSYS